MERVLNKFLTKYWWVGNRSEMVLIILKQIVQDVQSYISSQIDGELANINLYPKLGGHRRSRSCPNIPAPQRWFGWPKTI